MSHASVERTSPTGRGKPFIGRCKLCGKEGLTMEASMNEECSAGDKFDKDELLIAAIENRDPEPSEPRP